MRGGPRGRGWLDRRRDVGAFARGRSLVAHELQPEQVQESNGDQA
jgi:hypothetical protein